MVPFEWEIQEEDQLRIKIVQTLLMKKKNFQGIWLSDKSAVDIIREERE
jgi:hypothetical protein